MNPHISVLKNEVLEIFSSLPKSGGTLIDCTLGFGGHSLALLQAHPKLSIIGIDQDREAREYSLAHLPKERICILEGNFSEKISQALQANDIVGVLADIGVSSLQLDDLNRGFSFNSPHLDMRMDQENPLNASIVLNSYPKIKLEEIFRDYGEIKEYRKMASLIVEERQKRPFQSAIDLSNFLQKHFKKHKIHPATLAFQAIRIEVNHELDALQSLLNQLATSIHQLPKAILAFISFHSLEDRIIKNTFKKWEKSCICPPEILRCECGNSHSYGRILNKKPITASQEELKNNPRSRSAKLRAFQFRESL